MTEGVEEELEEEEESTPCMATVSVSSSEETASDVGVGMCRAVIKQEHSFGFKMHLSQFLLNPRDKVMMEPVCKQSCINPSI